MQRKEKKIKFEILNALNIEKFSYHLGLISSLISEFTPIPDEDSNISTKILQLQGEVGERKREGKIKNTKISKMSEFSSHLPLIWSLK